MAGLSSKLIARHYFKAADCKAPFNPKKYIFTSRDVYSIVYIITTKGSADAFK